MASTKSRRRARDRGAITKAIDPGLMRGFAEAPKGIEPVRYGLMDALNIVNARAMGADPAAVMPRDPRDLATFGPGNPLPPEFIDRPNKDGTADPRIYEYQQSWNLPGNQRKEVPWQVLRQAADGVDLVRLCIEARKAHIGTLQWSWAPKEQVIEDAYAASPKDGYEDAAQKIREQFMPEIKRLTEFWERPWRTRGLSFRAWVRMVVEEYLVVDGMVVYPRKSYGGDVLDLELVDASTIKPLLDHRGSRPLPPYPAFQQELYGFPRGEWRASGEYDENGKLPNAYEAGELYYGVGNPRLFSPYGFSPVEQVLFSARLWLKRQGWLLAEYDDGSTPLTMIEPPGDPALVGTFTPAQRREWEDALNGEYGGQTRARHRAKVLPPGWTPHQLSSVDERYKPEFDLFIVKLVAGFMGMRADQLGFSETQGLGSAGWAESQAEAQGRVGLKPDTEVLSEVINCVSRDFLGAPPELEFTFNDPTSENDKESDDVRNQQRARATITLNDDRRALKLPLLSLPEADMPHFVTATGPVFMEGAFQRAEEAAQAQMMQAETAKEGTKGKLELEQAKLDDGAKAREEDREFQRETRDSEQEFAREQADTTTKAVTSELAAFATWRKRNPEPKRPFVFKAATPDDFDEPPGPDVADFGDEWLWVTDEMIEKRAKSGLDWKAWNALHPNKPKGPNGRWVKRGSLFDAPDQGRSLVDVLTEDSKLQADVPPVTVAGPSGAIGDPIPRRDTPAYNRAVAQIRITGPGNGSETTPYLDRAPEEGDLVTAGGLNRKGTVIRAIRRHRTDGFDVAWEGSPYTSHATASQLQVVDVAEAIRRNRVKESGGSPVTPEEPEAPKPTVYDRLLSPDSEFRVKNRSMAKLVEQMEAHGWEAKGQDTHGSVTTWEAPDGRTLQIQFITGEKPIIYGRGYQKLTFRAATAHVVTPTPPEQAPGPRVPEAMQNLGLTPIPAMHVMGGNNDPWLDPLRRAQQGMHPVGSYGGRGESAQQAATGLRQAAERYREAAQKADELYGYGSARGANSVRREELADQFEQVAAELERMDTAYMASIAERERLAALPLDIRPAKVRTAGQAPGSMPEASNEEPEAPKAEIKIPQREGKARRGDVMVVEEKTRDYVIGEGSKERTEYKVYEVTSVSREGEPLKVRDLQWLTGERSVKIGNRVDRSMSGRRQIIPGDQLDVAGLSAALNARTYPNSTTPMAHDSLADLRDMIRPHLAESGATPRPAPPDPDKEWAAVLKRIQGAGGIDAQLRQVNAELSKPLTAETRQKLEDIKARNAERFAAIEKAVEPDPKAEAPVDERWPGWAQDLAIAAGTAASLGAALAAGAASLRSVQALAGLFAEWAQGWRPSDPRPDVLTWLQASTDLGPRIEADIRQPIEDAWLEGYFVGSRSAAALVENLAAGIPPREAGAVEVDWGNWTPGDLTAARRIMTADGSIRPWLDLLRDAGITIKRIADNRLQEVARCLHDGLQRGLSPDQIAKDLQRTINDPAWCKLVAVTETNRAMSAATLDTYELSGIDSSEWMTALDQRVCKRCKANEDAGPVRLGQRYPSGDYHPPGHPRCRCALVPTLGSLDLIKRASSGLDWRAWNAAHPNRRRDSQGRWGRGNGVSLAAEDPLSALDWLTDEDDGNVEAEAAPSIAGAWGQPVPEPEAPRRRPVTLPPQLRMPATDLFDVTDETVRMIGAQQAYDGTFGGYTTAVVDVFRAAHVFQVKGNIYGPDGAKVGHFSRMLARDRGPRGNRDGKLYAIQASLELEREHQGQGFAEAFNAHLFDWYRASGLDRVELTANIDVGGYAWARNGYDWADKDAPRSIIRNLTLHAQLDSGVIPAERLAEQQQLAREMVQRFKTTKFGHPDYPTPYEVSQLGRWPGAGKDDWWIGKRALWGSTWDGVKPL